MNKYVAFLRGINVGKIKVSMNDLQDLFEDLGFQEVKTYLNTGNVFFISDLKSSDIKIKLEDELTQKFKYQANVLIYTLDELKEVVNNYPFEHKGNDYHRYIVLVRDEDKIKEIMLDVDEGNLTQDQVESGEMAIYWQVPKGETLESVAGKIFAKANYKKFTTTRNINTLEKIISDN